MPVQHLDGANGPLPKDAPRRVAPDQGELARERMLGWARWSIANRAHFAYTQGPARWHMVESAPGTLPQTCDCSSFVTGLAKWAGASDPNGLKFKAGYTGTLLEHCNHIPRERVRMGDLIVYGPGHGEHAVFVMAHLDGDLALASHGHQGDPGRRLHSQMLAYFGGVATYLRWLS